MDEFLPILITYDEVIDMWSYKVGYAFGVADNEHELVEKIWKHVREWNE